MTTPNLRKHFYWLKKLLVTCSNNNLGNTTENIIYIDIGFKNLDKVMEIVVPVINCIFNGSNK